ncbi:hypothetical protein [Flavobacterium sp.]|jgi:hypothetical protein|uniref:hypothetical protein n=1 Tax=Flavobacterium sp. TaxID=239 RepID=UPI0037BE2722
MRQPTLTNASGVAITGMPTPTTANLTNSYTGSRTIIVASVSSSLAYNLAIGTSQTINYSLSGAQTSSGVHSLSWAYGNLRCSKTKNIRLGEATFTNALNNVYVFSVNDTSIPINNQGTLATGSRVAVAYTRGLGSYLAYKSPDEAMPSAYCEDGASNWTLGYSYSEGTFSTIENLTITLINKKTEVISAWPAKHVSNITTININCVSLPWIVNSNTYSNTVGLDKGGETIRGTVAIADKASGIAYDAGTVSQLIPVTLSEYNQILSTVSGAVNKGIKKNTAISALDYSTSIGGANSAQWTNLNLNSYICVVTTGTYTNVAGANTIIKVAPTSAVIPVCITDLTANVSWVANTPRYFAVKRPTTNYGNNIYLGKFFTGNIGGIGAGKSSGTGYLGAETNCGTASPSRVHYDDALQVISSTVKSC